MPTRWRSASWSVIGLLATVNLLHYANRNVVAHAHVFEDLRELFGVTEAEIGLLGTAFMVPHALVTLPVAWLSDRLDRRRVIAFGVVVWSGAGVLSAFAWDTNSLLLARAAVGAGTAACVPMANAIICDLVPADRQARTLGVYNLSLFLGGVVGVGLAGFLGFPFAFIAVAAPGFLFALLLLTVVVKRRAEAPEMPHTSEGFLATFSADLRALLGLPAMRWMMLGAVLMAFAAGGYAHWFIEFLVNTVGLSENQANALFGLALIGGVLGVVAGGFVADAFYRRSRAGRQLAVSLGFTLATICAVLTLVLPATWVFYAIGFLLMFFISWYHGPIAAAVDDQVPPTRAATAQGTYIAMMHLFGTAPSSYVVGRLADDFGLRKALFVPTAAMAIAAIAFLLAGRSVWKDPVVNKQ